jgi:glutamyl-tRNA synthetase
MDRRPARVRFAPSPTGRMHLGSARTALYDYLLAQQTGGQFILRLEDTDQKRFVPGSEEEIKQGMRWLGIEWDEGLDVGGPYGPYRQSERKELYLEHAHQLIEKNQAYYCFCSPDRLERLRQEQIRNKLPMHYDGTCRHLEPEEAARRVRNGERHVIRFKTPVDGSITFKDRLRGNITVENKNIDDYILVKSDGLALYHLAAMVDDHLMKITHVIRGSEWLSTFPLHIHIVRAFGWQEPEWIHLSVFLKPSGKGKMSKRETAEAMKDGYSIFIGDMQNLGYLPEAVVNWIALMGWSYDDKTEFFTMQELIEKFDLDRLNPAPAAINFSKLDHFNGLHIRSLPIPVLTQRIKPFFEKAGIAVTDEKLSQVTSLIQERMVTLDEAPERGGFFFQSEVKPEPSELIIKGLTPTQSLDVAHRALRVIAELPDFTHLVAEPPLRSLAEELDLEAGQVFGFLRVAITGQAVSPPLLESMTVIGKETVLARLRSAIKLLENLNYKVEREEIIHD